MPREIPLLRTSERSDALHCEWLWWHTWHLGLTTRRQPTWAWFGTAIHKALEVRYPVGRRRGHMADVLDAFQEATDGEQRRMWTEGLEPDEEEVHEASELGRAMLIGYEQRWGMDQNWEVIHSEQSFQIDVPDWRNPDRTIAVFAGTWDLIVYDRHLRKYYVVDHKTRRSFPKTFTFYDLNRQAGGYLWVAPQVLEHMGIFKKGNRKHVLDGLIFNMLRKAMPDERPVDADGVARNQPKKEHYIEALGKAGVIALNSKSLYKVGLEDLKEAASREKLNVLGEPSMKQPSPLFARYTSRRTPEERVRQARHVQEEVKRLHRLRKGVDQPRKNTAEECTRCKLFDMCQLDELDPLQGAEYRDSVMVRRDPYADHREAMKRGGVHL